MRQNRHANVINPLLFERGIFAVDDVPNFAVEEKKVFVFEDCVGLKVGRNAPVALHIFGVLEVRAVVERESPVFCIMHGCGCKGRFLLVLAECTTDVARSALSVFDCDVGDDEAICDFALRVSACNAAHVKFNLFGGCTDVYRADGIG